MRALFILSVLLVASANGNSFTDFFHNLGLTLKPIATSLLDNLKTTGTALLQQGIQIGKGLLSQGLQALLVNTQTALQTKKSLNLTPLLQKVETAVHTEIEKLGGELHNVFGWLVNGLEGILKRITTLDISPDAIVSEIDKLVGTHNLMADAFLKVIVQKVESTVASLMGHKRNAFTDFFKNLGTQIATTAKPYIDGVKNLAVTTGQAIKNAGLNLVNTAKQTVQTLGTKLQPHIDNLKAQTGLLVHHGTNALTALQNAGKDILLQTVMNMLTPLHNIKTTLQNATQTAVNHVATNVLG